MSETTREQLEAELVALRSQNAAQAGEIERLTRMITELEQRLDKGSKNSSVPPSADSPKKRAEATKTRADRRAKVKAKRKDDVERRRGKQPGTPGANLAMRPDPDEIVNHLPTNCGSCGDDLADAPVEDTEYRQVFDIPKPVLGCVEHRAGVDILVGALGALRREGVPVSLLVIGDGTPRYMREFEKIVERYGLRQNYFQIREVRNDELPLLLSQCDVCVAPFRLRDTSMMAFQNKVLEYLTVDVPIVATRSEALEWALGDAVCLVDPENEKALASAVWDAIKDSTMSRHQMKRRNAIRQSLE